MDARFVAVAMPPSFVAIGIELLEARRRGVRVYRFADAIRALPCGITSEVLGVFTLGLVTAACAKFHARFARFTLDGALAYAVAFPLVDLAYHLWHRSSHRVNLRWAGHAAPHRSEDHTLAVALRQTLRSRLTVAPFHRPLAVLGVPTAVLGGTVALDLLCPSWIHTRLVGRLGPLEHVLDAPSHHRVHHGVDPWAIDRNDGGVLIVWDRLFGTFAPARHEPVYGVVQGFRSWDPLRAKLPAAPRRGTEVAGRARPRSAPRRLRPAGVGEGRSGGDPRPHAGLPLEPAHAEARGVDRRGLVRPRVAGAPMADRAAPRSRLRRGRRRSLRLHGGLGAAPHAARRRPRGRRNAAEGQRRAPHPRPAAGMGRPAQRSPRPARGRARPREAAPARRPRSGRPPR